jgi:hypothetical protein
MSKLSIPIFIFFPFSLSLISFFLSLSPSSPYPFTLPSPPYPLPSSQAPTARAPGASATAARHPASASGGKAVKGRRSRMEPRFRGSASPVEALCGSATSSIPIDAVEHPVWQGSAWKPELELLLEPCQTRP